MKYKKIIGGTEKDAEEKFPWLKEANFEEAIVDISKDYLIWKGGTWKADIRWDNIKQEYQKVIQINGKFRKVKKNKKAGLK